MRASASSVRTRLVVSPASRRPAGSSQRYLSAGRRYWRTSNTRFLSSTAIITALPMWRTTLRLISNFVLGSTAASSVTRKRPQSYTCLELVIFMI